VFIVIEGADGVGKATQVKLLAERLAKCGYESEVFSFPRYGTPLGQIIGEHLRRATGGRSDAITLQCMMTADKYDAAMRILERIGSGAFVVCDRWWPSAFAYGVADGLPPEWLVNIHDRLPVPDLNILIELPADESLQRRPELRDRYEKDRVLQDRVRENYRTLWRENVSTRWPVVDGGGTPEEVHERVFGHVMRRVK
jgi:dTMP kinase